MFRKFESFKQTNKRFPFTPIIMVLGLMVISFFASSYFIPIPEFKFVENIKTNQPLLFESHKKFWVEVDNKKTYSKEKDNVEKVNLGKIQGKKQYTFGGYIDIGFFKFESKNTKTYSLDRDYSSIDTAFDIRRFIVKEDPDKSYTIRISGRDDFEIIDEKKVLYSTKAESGNICTPQQSTNDAKIFKCPIEFQEDKASITVFVKDFIGNKIKLISEQLVNIVPAVKLDCNYDSVITSSILKCKSNKIATGSIEGIEQQYFFKPNEEISVRVNIKDGKNNIKFNLKDEHELSSTFEININAIKQV